MDQYKRTLDRIDGLGQQGWHDRNSEGSVRNLLLGLRIQRLLDRDGLVAEMRARGHDDEALMRLNVLIDKTFREPMPPNWPVAD